MAALEGQYSTVVGKRSKFKVWAPSIFYYMDGHCLSMKSLPIHKDISIIINALILKVPFRSYCIVFISVMSSNMSS